MNISEEDQHLFRQNLAGVTRLKNAEHFCPPKPKPRRLRAQALHTQWHEAHWCSPDHHATHTISAHLPMYFQRPEITAKQMTQLSRGQFATRCIIDLHGLTEQQAEDQLTAWLAHCRHRSDRYALIIHGKGLGSQTQHPVLKNFVNWWLRNQPRILAFTSAQIADGGTGAVYALLAGGEH